VGKGILHWKMRNHPKVVVMEKTNARYVKSLPEPIDFVTIDASFISLKILLPVVKKWITPLRLPPFSPKMGGMPRKGEGGRGVVTLIKPQFEAGRKDVSRGDGVIRKPEIHRQVLMEVLTFAQEEGFGLKGLIRSPITGPKGNVEFLAWLGIGIPPTDGEPPRSGREPAGARRPSGMIQVSAWIDAVAPLEKPLQDDNH
jgi:23S rRNA (cytidine1920-2'-O)/16S rRNA (cytidine1409-2'-O)-methyltransferase